MKRMLIAGLLAASTLFASGTANAWFWKPYTCVDIDVAYWSDFANRILHDTVYVCSYDF